MDQYSSPPTGEKGTATLMSILRPILRFNQFMGVCPHEISGDIMIFRWRSVHFFRTLLTLFVLTVYSAYMTVQFVLSFFRGRGTSEITFLALWLAFTVVPVAKLVCTLRKRHHFTKFFEKMWEYKEPLKGMINCDKTLVYSRKLCALYVLLCGVSCALVCWSTVRKPRGDASILILFLDESEEPSTLMLSLGCLFQCYLIVVQSCASAFIEVITSSLSTSFYHTVIRIKDDMEKSLKRNSHQRVTSPGQKVDGHYGFIDSGGGNKGMSYQPYIQRVNDLDNWSSGKYPSLSQVESSGGGTGHNTLLGFSLSPPGTNNPDDNNYKSFPDNTGDVWGTTAIMLAIKRFNCIANMQRVINCIFGALLALDTALLVFMSCVLLYLQMNYLGSKYTDKAEGIIFLGNGVCIFIRLVTLFVNLASVLEASNYFNGVLTSSLTEVRRPRAMDVNLILAHLSTHSINPVAYSASGFFVFSKSSLLAVFSAIITYAVFLLQVKN